MDTDHFQAPFGVIIFGHFQIENNPFEKPQLRS